MGSVLSQKIEELMTKEMGQLGKFIVKKQCKDLGIDPDNIRPEDLPALAKALGKVMRTFGGDEKAARLEREIRRLAQ